MSTAIKTLLCAGAIIIAFLLWPPVDQRVEGHEEIQLLASTTDIKLLEVVNKIPPPKPKSVAELIVEYSLKYNLSSKTMLRIAMSESKFQNVPNYLYDGESGHRTAYGIFQITRSTYKGFCGNPKERLTIEKNIECAMIIASKSGLHHWSESKSGWDK